MVRKIMVETILKYLGTGVSRPAVVVGDDFQHYILKTQKVSINGKSTIHDCMFLNELLAFQIAKYLDIPIPEAAIAFLDKKVIDNDPSATFVHRFYEGNLFASSELPEKEDNLVENYEQMIHMRKPYISRTWNAFFANIVNAEDIAKIIAFDILIGNFDRYANEGNLLISNTEEGRKIFTIDHGHAFFGPEWGTQKIQNLKAPTLTNDYITGFVNLILHSNVFQRGNADGLGNVFHAIESRVDLTNLLSHSFLEIVESIENITEDMITEWINEIPDEWFNKSDKDIQIAYYKHFILSQKLLVRHIIQQLADRRAFTNFLGGVLKWKEDKNVGTV